MNIAFCSPSIEELANSAKELTRTYGDQARIIQKRLTQLAAATSMKAFAFDRPHVLVGEYKGCIAVDLGHPYRLVFRPIGTFDLSKRETIVEIEVQELCKDYH